MTIEKEKKRRFLSFGKGKDKDQHHAFSSQLDSLEKKKKSDEAFYFSALLLASYDFFYIRN
jgi:hypothetical protein